MLYKFAGEVLKLVLDRVEVRRSFNQQSLQSKVTAALKAGIHIYKSTSYDTCVKHMRMQKICMSTHQK